jgi:hypothetical protein
MFSTDSPRCRRCNDLQYPNDKLHTRIDLRSWKQAREVAKDSEHLADWYRNQVDAVECACCDLLWDGLVATLGPEFMRYNDTVTLEYHEEQHRGGPVAVSVFSKSAVERGDYSKSREVQFYFDQGASSRTALCGPGRLPTMNS